MFDALRESSASAQANKTKARSGVVVRVEAALLHVMVQEDGWG